MEGGGNVRERECVYGNVCNTEVCTMHECMCNVGVLFVQCGSVCVGVQCSTVCECVGSMCMHVQYGNECVMCSVTVLNCIA